jgi:hypothetical protein
MEEAPDGERVVPLSLPEPEVEHPLPIVLSKDGVLVLSYMAFMANRDKNIVVSFHTAYGHRFGPPSRSGLSAHPLAARGLKRDGAFEVKGSSWVRDSFGGKGRHYAFTFKDALFECAADGYGSEIIEEDDDAIRVMARRLYK